MRIVAVEPSPPFPSSLRVLVPATTPDADISDAITHLAREEGPEPLPVRHVGEDESGSSFVTLGRVGGDTYPLPASHRDRFDIGRILLAPTRWLKKWPSKQQVFVEGTLELEPVPGTECEKNVDVPLLRLHVPRRSGATATDLERTGGCEAEYTMEYGASETVSYKFTISGVGVGGETTVTATSSDTYKTIEADGCIEVVTPGRVEMAVIVMRLQGMEINRVPSGRVILLEKGYVDPRTLPPEDDGCGQPYEIAKTLAGRFTSDLRDPGDPPDKHVDQIGKKGIGKFGVDFELGSQPPIKLEFGLERETTTTATVTTNLVPGACYTTYVPASGATIERCWTTAA